MFFSVHNTLYLEVHCPTVRPHMVVVSDSGRTVVDFANVSLGEWTGTPAIFFACDGDAIFVLNGRVASARCWLQTPVTTFVMLL